MKELTFIDPKTRLEYVSKNYRIYERYLNGRKITVAVYTRHTHIPRSSVKMFKIINDVPKF